MSRSLWIRVAVVIVAAVVFSGCKKPLKVEKPEYDRPLPPGEFALRKITDPAMIPDITFACYETLGLRDSINNSLHYLNKPVSKKFYPSGEITHERAIASVRALLKLLDEGLAGRPLAAAINEQFEFYQSVGCDDRGTVLFTGYYTPIFNGSFQRTDIYKYPLYKKPVDLVKDEDGTILGKRNTDGTYSRYPDRRQIESSGMLKGLELIYLADPFEVYIAHVQGSAKIRTPDGQLTTVGYTANNGHDYRSIGQELIKDRVMPKDGLSLSAMIEFFKANPALVDDYIYRNPRYVFFEIDKGEPRGSLNEPVTPMRTIATDKSIYPRGCISVLKTRLPRPMGIDISKRAYTGFAMDQDTGGAIRAPGRCDVYIGSGDRAGKMAGQVYEEGKLYYLFIKPELMTSEAVSGQVPDKPQPSSSAY